MRYFVFFFLFSFSFFSYSQTLSPAQVTQCAVANDTCIPPNPGGSFNIAAMEDTLSSPPMFFANTLWCQSDFNGFPFGGITDITTGANGLANSGKCIYTPPVCAEPLVGEPPNCECPNDGQHQNLILGQTSACAPVTTCDDGQVVIDNGSTNDCDIPPEACPGGGVFDSISGECAQQDFDGNGVPDAEQGNDPDDGTGDDGTGDDGTGDDGTGDDGTGDDGTGDDGTGDDGTGDDGTGNDGTGDDGTGSVGGGSGDDCTGEDCEDSGSASGGGTCESEPTCEGDEIGCAQLQQAWLMRCGMSEGEINNLADSAFSDGETALDDAIQDVVDDVNEFGDTGITFDGEPDQLKGPIEGMLPSPVPCSPISLDVPGPFGQSYSASLDCEHFITFKEFFGYFLAIMTGAYIWSMAMRPVER